MEQAAKLYVCHLTTVTEREALYTSQYFFDEGELVAICEDCLNFFKRIFFPVMSLFQIIKKMFNRNVYDTEGKSFHTSRIPTNINI